MPKKVIVISSKAGYESASSLAEKLKAKYENPFESGNRNFTDYDVVIKYGFSRPIKSKKGSVIINKTEPTSIALNKISTFKAVGNISVPFTENIKEAAKWLKEGTVVARETENGHDSEGVVFCDTADELLETNAKFYTKYVDHTNEFRINIWRNKVVTVYDKVNNKGTFNFKLFQGVEDHPQLVDLVNKVYESVGLDWYGLDVLRDKKGKLYVLEINSAPVLYPITLKKLTTIISKEILT